MHAVCACCVCGLCTRTCCMQCVHCPRARMDGWDGMAAWTSKGNLSSSKYSVNTPYTRQRIRQPPSLSYSYTRSRVASDVAFLRYRPGLRGNMPVKAWAAKPLPPCNPNDPTDPSTSPLQQCFPSTPIDQSLLPSTPPMHNSLRPGLSSSSVFGPRSLGLSASGLSASGLSASSSRLSGS